MQQVANNLNCKVISLYGIAGHGKGEVDHVGGLAKVAIWREIAAGNFFPDSNSMVNFLNAKYSEKNNPAYFFKDIMCNTLDTERSNERLLKHRTVDGSNSFQIILFTPNADTFKASPHICICDSCMSNYGSCSLFEEFQLHVQFLNKVSLRDNFLSEEQNEEQINYESSVDDFILPNTICAIAADNNSSDTVWFIRIIKEDVAVSEIMDDFGHVANGMKFFRGNYLEQNKPVKDGVLYHLNSKRETFIYRESVVYPFVQFETRKNFFFLHNNELLEIINFVESNHLKPI